MFIHNYGCLPTWWGLNTYIFLLKNYFKQLVSCNVFWLLDLNVLWSLVDVPHLELVHYNKHEIMKKIANMKMESSQLITWSTHVTLATNASSQWGHNIKIVHEPRKIARSKRVSWWICLALLLMGSSVQSPTT